MKIKNSYKFIITSLFIVMFSAFILTSSSLKMTASAEKSLEENKQYAKELQSDLSSIESSLKSLKASIAKSQKEQKDQLYIKNQLDQEISLSQKKITTIENLIAEYTKQISNKEQEIENIDVDISDRLSIIRERLILQQENGNSDIIAYVLGSKDFADLLTRVEVANELFEYDKRIIESLGVDREKQLSAKEELETVKTSCEEQKKELEAAKVELDKKMQNADSYLKKLENDEAGLQKRLKAAQAEMTAIENEIKEIQSRIKAQQTVDYSGDGFRFPLPYDVTYWWTSKFGWRVWDSGRATDYHKGIDLACARGTDIYASNSGEVIISKYSNSYGNYVVVDHGGGITTLYAHCSKLCVNVGDQVKKGDKIAEVGSTGDSTGNHLHFSVLVNGNHVDPTGYVTLP